MSALAPDGRVAPTRRGPWLRRTAWGLFSAALLLLPLAVGSRPFELRLLTLMLLFGAMGQGWNILGGYAGQTAIGHGLFFGLGAYASLLVMREFGVSPWVAAPAAALVCMLAGTLIGWPCFKLRGHYFVIATLVIAESASLLFTSWDWAGGAMGLELPIRPESLLNLQFHRSKLPYYYVALALVAGATALTALLERSKVGFVLRAIRDDEEAVRSLGFSPLRYKLIAMAASTAIVGLCGAFHLQYVLFIDPPSVLGLGLSVMIALIPILGGVGTLAGPIVGAVILVSMSEYARIIFSGGGRGVDLMIYGGLIMGIALYRPAGIMSLLRTERVVALRMRLGLGR
jgi:branched-chain amino acid transport system permease protein